MVRRKGRLIAIEGIDQAGKRTQAHLLADNLKRKRRPVSVWNFPDYSTPIGRQLKAYLEEKVALDLHAIHLLYAANKWEVAEKLKNKIEKGEVVIVNRYTPSNMTYGSAHGLPRDWLEALEQGLPKPDVILVLDVSPRTSLARKQIGRDVHENDLTYLNKVRKTYLFLARKRGWEIVSGRGEPEMVRRSIWEKVAPILGYDA